MDSLPTDSLNLIISFLDTQSRVRLCRVCKRFRVIVWPKLSEPTGDVIKVRLCNVMGIFTSAMTSHPLWAATTIFDIAELEQAHVDIVSAFIKHSKKVKEFPKILTDICMTCYKVCQRIRCKSCGFWICHEDKCEFYDSLGVYCKGCFAKKSHSTPCSRCGRTGSSHQPRVNCALCEANNLCSHCIGMEEYFLHGNYYCKDCVWHCDICSVSCTINMLSDTCRICGRVICFQCTSTIRPGIVCLRCAAAQMEM